MSTLTTNRKPAGAYDPMVVMIASANLSEKYDIPTAHDLLIQKWDEEAGRWTAGVRAIHAGPGFMPEWLDASIIDSFQAMARDLVRSSGTPLPAFYRVHIGELPDQRNPGVEYLVTIY